MADFQSNHLDRRISQLKKQLKKQNDIHAHYQSQLDKEPGLEYQQPQHPRQHKNKSRNHLAKKYHIKYEDTMDTRKNGLKQLNQMIGLKSVKDLIKHYIAGAEIDRRARELGQDNKLASLNMIFMGNPGTGKTVVARLVGKILFQKHIIPKPLFKECSARDLLSTLVGGALLKTHRLMQHSRGGVLFIDEAYILASNANGNDAENSSKQDAVSELLRMAENNRYNTVVILAGYQDRMEKLLNNSNEGLRSRFNHKVLFPDYTNNEMYKILMLHAKQAYCIINRTDQQLLKVKLPHFIKFAKLHHEDSNARLMRNLLQMIISCHQYHLATTKNIEKLTLKEINTISARDIKIGLQRAQNNE